MTDSRVPKSFHMSPEELQKYGRDAIDWVAGYLERVETFPVLSRVEPGAIRSALPSSPPETGEPFSRMLEDVERIILPGITHWQSPNFFAYFPGNSSAPSILGEVLSAGLAVQGMLWTTSPACTELETHVLDWLADMLGLPEDFKSSARGGGVIQDTASSANLCALLAARERTTGFASNRRGCDGSLTAYATAHTHSSVEKGMKIAGLGSENLRLVEADENYAMRPQSLETAIEEDRAAGRLPSFVCATVGSTSSHAMDPLRPIGEICRRHQLWLHVDAAMAGAAAVCPEFRHLQDGLELADSYCFDPHKWMFTNLDCSCMYVADRHALIDTLSVTPEYLRNPATDTGEVFDYRDWHIQLGRRFRSLKLWFVIRHYGVEGLRHHVREHVALAQELASWIADDPRFELAAPVPLNLVCFRYRGDHYRGDRHGGGDDANRHLLDRLNRSGALFLTHTRLDDRLTLRLCVGQTTTSRRHVEAAWGRICEEAGRLED